MCIRDSYNFMVSEQLIWIIFFLPLISFAVISLIVRPFLNQISFIAGPIAILAIGSAFAISLLTFFEIGQGNHHLVEGPYEWFSIGSLAFTVGILMDPLTAIMLVVVTGVCLMVQVYSIGYMKPPKIEDQSYTHGPSELGKPVYPRYFAYMLSLIHI